MKRRWTWIAVLALSPIVYFAGVRLAMKHDPNANAGFTVDRNGAIDAARRYLTSRGFGVNGWDSVCIITPNDNLYFYYPLHPGSDAEIAKKLSPDLIIGVLLISPDTSENIEVLLNKDGKPLGFTRTLSRLRELKDPGEPASRRLAEEALQERIRQFGISALPQLTLQESSESGNIIRRYIWKWPLPSLDGLTVRSVLTTRGGALMSDIVEAEFDKNYPQQKLNADSPMKKANGILYGLVVTLVLIFGIYRFVQRVKQKEISFSRIAILTGFFASTMGIFVLISDVATYGASKIPDLGVTRGFIIFVAFMAYGSISLFIGIAYGSGEGDIRESYPGKLTSLDALIHGRILSKNVALAIILGCALGGWVLLLMSLLDLYWLGKPASGESYSALELWFGYLPALSPFAYVPMDVLLVCVIGLLVPLPFLRRRFSSHRVIIPLLAIFVWIATAGPYISYRPWTGRFVEAAIRAAFFLVGFFFFDLLTAMITLAAPSFFFFAICLASQPITGLHKSGVIALSVALISLVVAIICAFKGRFYQEDEVRPVYAKHLSERLSMKAEVSAAREAQKRLMPESLPKIEHFSIAASCAPAYEVGGDFYDLFELEPGKLGILIAEGGGKGLSSALSIAFAKGFLMPKIFNDGRSGDDSPTEIIRSLQDRLLTMLNDEAGVGLAYAVIDASDGTLRYARVGSHPAIAVSRGKQSNKLIPAEERELHFKSTQGANADVSVIEGRLTLEVGDSVILFTDGLDKDWKMNGTNPEIEFAKVLQKRNAHADNLQDALTNCIKKRSKLARKRGSDDDLTAVIVQLEHQPEDERTREGTHL